MGGAGGNGWGRGSWIGKREVGRAGGKWVGKRKLDREEGGG